MIRTTPRGRRASLHWPGTSLKWRLPRVKHSPRRCGSAGTYSILQPQLSARLLRLKVAALESGTPDLIATANIGCLMHIGGGTSVPVCHWVELLAQRLDG